ncbi:hypothetical protein [Nesterenkonia flava]|uniref:Uncharacterized protein n=1 Tax=Nesterenkonia flava TaxID=469799 RepID=A0ABU1FRG7_9MICC|nr:hypothetical protein [Nesterenkonia flava]MDR5710778.1 hypothetical protein [Nesterenkonia flava]
MSSGHFLFFHSGRVVGSFERSMSSLASHQARQACTSRQMMQTYLKTSEVPQPERKILHVNEMSAAVRFLAARDEPMYVLPGARRTWRSSRSLVHSEEQLVRTWEKIALASEILPPLHQHVVLEKPQPGLDLRLFVIGERVVGTLLRLPLFVVGNGRDSISALFQELHELLRPNEYLRLPSQEQLENYLRWTMRAATDIPRPGQVVHLTSTRNTGPGASFTVELEGQIDGALGQLAVDAMWAFPGLNAAAVDIRTPALDSAEGAVVLDVDPGAEIAEFRYPVLGQRRRVAVHMIDHMVEAAR